jgi:hypothetical protein
MVLFDTVLILSLYYKSYNVFSCGMDGVYEILYLISLIVE